MNTNFNRNRVQSELENILNSKTLDLKQKKTLITQHNLSQSDVATLKSNLTTDCVDYFYNGLVCFSEGFYNAYFKRYAWATIKLYYSLYYFMRTSLATQNYTLLNLGSIYRLKISRGETPFGSNHNKYKSTHGGTISHYKETFTNKDILLTNSIGTSESTYDWYKEAREIVNYKKIPFCNEASFINEWNVFNNFSSNNKIDELIGILLNDRRHLCTFQEDYALISIPINLLKQTISNIKTSNMNFIDKEHVSSLKNLLFFSTELSKIFDEINSEQ